MPGLFNDRVLVFFGALLLDEAEDFFLGEDAVAFELLPFLAFGGMMTAT